MADKWCKTGIESPLLMKEKYAVIHVHELCLELILPTGIKNQFKHNSKSFKVEFVFNEILWFDNKPVFEFSHQILGRGGKEAFRSFSVCSISVVGKSRQNFLCTQYLFVFFEFVFSSEPWDADWSRMTSYDELLKQVESLKAENSHLRQELNESTSHPESALDVFVGLDGDSDIDVIYDGEDGIHVFQQGGGGEGRDHDVDGK